MGVRISLPELFDTTEQRRVTIELSFQGRIEAVQRAVNTPGKPIVGSNPTPGAFLTKRSAGIGYLSSSYKRVANSVVQLHRFAQSLS